MRDKDRETREVAVGSNIHLETWKLFTGGHREEAKQLESAGPQHPMVISLNLQQGSELPANSTGTTRPLTLGRGWTHAYT